MITLPTAYLPKTVGISAAVVAVSVMLDSAGPDARLLLHLVALVHGVPPWAGLMVAIFIAASLSSIVGFAFSAIAAALMLHLATDHVQAVQIMMISSIAIQSYSVANIWRNISWGVTMRFALPGIATIPCGVFLLFNLPLQTFIATLGLIVAAYGLYMLHAGAPRKIEAGLAADVWVGAMGGIMGPLAAFPGGFITIWCGLRGWDKLTQRAVYQPYILVIQVTSLAALGIFQNTTFDVGLAVYALPAIMGAWIGLNLFKKLTDRQFQTAINVALVFSGMALVLKTLLN